MNLAPHIPQAVIVTPGGQPAGAEAVRNQWYEGSRWSPNRSWVWYPAQSAKRDLDRFTRYELCKHSRYLHKNSPLIRGLTERLVNLVIGSGIHPVPISSDHEWNELAKARWRAICRRPCVDARHTMSQYQRITARARFIDGECFTIKTFRPGTGRPALQGLEAIRITNRTGTGAGDSAERNVDGVLLDRAGAPAAYQVQGVETPYPAQFIVQHYTPTRHGMIRGEPILASAINHARDVDDILALEKQAVKDASGHLDIIKTQTGDLDPETFRSLRYNTTGGYPTTTSLPGDAKTRDDYYRVQFGAEPIVLKTGDEYTPYVSQRPGAAWQGFMDFLSQNIVLSTGLPPSLLLPVSLGGTDIRRDLEIAQRVVENWQTDLAAEWQEIWEYLIGEEIADGPLHGAPEDWQEVRWQFPKSITVDRGRDAAQDRADVACGLMSREEYHGRYGDDGADYERAIIDETAARRDRITAAGFATPFDYVQWLSLSGSIYSASAQVTPSDADGQPLTPANPRPPTAPAPGAPPAKRKTARRKPTPVHH